MKNYGYFKRILLLAKNDFPYIRIAIVGSKNYGFVSARVRLIVIHSVILCLLNNLKYGFIKQQKYKISFFRY